MTLRQPHNQYSNMRVPSFREEEQTLVESRISGGMVTAIDAADIENNQFVDVRNAVVRYDKTSRRSGITLFTPSKPDSNPVYALVPYERFDQSVILIRMTPGSIHSLSGGVWTAVTGTLTGSTNDRFQTTIANDRLFFTNNGADPIQEFNPTAHTFANAGNAPRYKYLTSFNNRIIGAYERGVTDNPIKVGWSGNLNLAQWDPSVDPSAGFELLIDSPTDASDPISGIFGLENVGLVLKKKSIWLIEKQPIANSPFKFTPLFPGIGCDSPYSATTIKNGIAWFDLRTGTVYAYKVGMQEPEPIGRPIEKTLVSQIQNSKTVFASYNTVDDEYILCLPSDTSSLVRMWTYNFRTKAWWVEEMENVTALSNIDYNSSSFTIDELLGTIDSLTGTIDSLTRNVDVNSRFIGHDDGELFIENRSIDHDNGDNYLMSLVSKLFSIPRHATYLSGFRIEYEPLVAGAFTVYYTRDGINWKLFKTISWDALEVGKRKMALLRKHVKCDIFSWKLEADTGLFDLLEYEIFFYPSQAESQTR